jgi:plasmid stability protein
MGLKRAAMNGRSMEEELRAILRAELSRPLADLDFGAAIRHSGER